MNLAKLVSIFKNPAHGQQRILIADVMRQSNTYLETSKAHCAAAFLLCIDRNGAASIPTPSKERAMSSELLPCPCGKVPESLCIQDDSMAGKWCVVSGSCCGEWATEFRANYAAVDSDECKELARKAWNAAPRAPLDLTDMEWGNLFYDLSMAADKQDYENWNKQIANAARAWMAGRKV